jgi:hypothetical protein
MGLHFHCICATPANVLCEIHQLSQRRYLQLLLSDHVSVLWKQMVRYASQTTTCGKETIQFCWQCPYAERNTATIHN